MTLVPVVRPDVNRPVLVTDPAPETIDQVGLTARTSPSEFLAVAVNCSWLFTVIDCGDVGETVSVDTTAGALLSLHAPARSPANATATRTLATRIRDASTAGTWTFMPLFIGLLLTWCM
jgi:hypothetical protein